MTAPFTIRIEGGLLSHDLLKRITKDKGPLPGSRPEDYYLPPGEQLEEAASRHWDYLLGTYRTFRKLLDQPTSAPTATLTREHWLLVLLSELGFGRVPQVGDLAAGAKSYPISHAWGHLPIHIVGWDRGLDQHDDSGSNAVRAPQSMLQEFLDASDDHLWGVLSNGKLLRILRASAALFGSSYVEFDLEAIFDGELYADFVSLFALLHFSRFELSAPAYESATPFDCWIEQWRTYAVETRLRVGDELRAGIKQALEELGTGFIQVNPSLRDALQRGPHHGGISAETFQHELLRLVYQLIFLFVAEDRGVLLKPDPDPRLGELDKEQAEREADLQAARERYSTYFSTARLRHIARHRRGDRHRDLWCGVLIVLNALSAEGGKPELALPELGGLYFPSGAPRQDASAPDFLRDCELPNDRLLTAIRLLSEISDGEGGRERIAFAELSAADLGHVYESLLELEPQPDTAALRFQLEARGPNHEHKTRGSYYTPTPLIESLLNTALDPVIDAYAASGVADDLLSITVCDPACGSGHFLVAAARRIARRYASIQAGDDEPTPEVIRDALSKVTRHCIYGVDINPLATEIAKASLWLESLEPGKPLAFLDAHIKVGNSLLGVTPKLLKEGIPDAAFKVADDDDPAVVRELRTANQRARTLGQLNLVDGDILINTGNLQPSPDDSEITTLQGTTLTDMRKQAHRNRELQNLPAELHRKQIADAWCAAFVWPKRKDAPPAITTETIRKLIENIPLSDDSAELLGKISSQYRFFHWHLEFPEIFQVVNRDTTDANPDTGWQGGFSCVLSNPPWGRVKLQDKEFFATRIEKISRAPDAVTRKKLIKTLADADDLAERAMYQEYQAALRESMGWLQLFRDSGRYPLTGHGDVSTYAVFAEATHTITGPRGRCGLVLPSGIATDATTAQFFADLLRQRALVSLFDFENEKQVLQGVHRRFRFCLFTMLGRALNVRSIELAFRMQRAESLEGAKFSLTPENIEKINPNTLTCPVFESRRDAEITSEIYDRLPVLWRDNPESNPWSLSFSTMLHLANDSHLFRAQDDAEIREGGWRLQGNVYVRNVGQNTERMIPLYEAKMIHHFDHRFSTYETVIEAKPAKRMAPRLTPEQHANADLVVLPRYWVEEREIAGRLEGRWDSDWLIGWRDITRSSDERTLIATALPWVAVGHNLPLIMPKRHGPLLLANLSSFVLDYISRQKLTGTSMAFFILKQLPVVPPERYSRPVEWLRGASLANWVEMRALELTYTAWDMELFARELGDVGPPFVWNDERRFSIRAELDAAYFHLYGVERDDVVFIMDSFRALRNGDPVRFARTKAMILETYDAMANAATLGGSYRTPLDPPPGRGSRHPNH
ncbi:Eco57I restriction-modification methylase domain-containing protein [Nonomuraea sp. WAC 01424]|uniref:Eco57I restriction-modification methylase domain-containing protein n=1 Tax=Nonomuraea sp. WAC 01424 TaxID=2203200 RepID=UPI0021ADDB44|nr:DNA methyltransferase [Nonomuraea sp. WAC 01424]